MYSIDKTEYGFRLFFGDKISKDEMNSWLEESHKNLSAIEKGGFGVLVDMRTLKPLDQDAKDVMEEGQALYRDKGMQRSAVILNSNILTLQFVKIGKKTKIGNNERYIDANQYPDWEERALRWLKQGQEPF